MTAIEKLIKTAESQIGYLEKATNANLDDPTANAGYNNWNKYARDIDQKYPNFYNGKKNGYSWCDVFVDWCYIETFGVSMAQKLLNQPNKSLGAGVDYSKAYFKAAGRLFNTPAVGDQVFFGTKHTGIVVQVSGNQFYTIEGNTSSGNTVVANGGGVFRKGPYNVTSDRTFGRPDWSLVDADYSENSSNSKAEEKSYSSTEIKYLQQNLTVLGYSCSQPDGVYGPKTKSALKQYEAANNLASDGLMDDEVINSIKNKIKDLQNNLNKLGYNCGTADGVAGNNTIEAVKKFQKTNELAQDGIAGKATQSKIQELLTESPTLKLGDSGLKVKNLQEALNKLGFLCGTADGDFGKKTLAAVKSFQKAVSLSQDGTVGKLTQAAIDKWLPKIYKGQVKVRTGLNIRQEDNANSKIIGEFYPNNIVEISVVKDGWLKLANKDGWVAKQYVEKI